MNKRCILLILLVLPFISPAQTVKWILKPAYSSITRFSDNLYLVKSGNKCGIIDRQGKFVVNEVDSVASLVEGYALLLDNYGKQWKIHGIMDKNGNVNKPESVFYVSSYPYFSEGFLAVSNSNGEYGFINPLGKEIILGAKYKMTHPFSEGLASVTLNKGGRVIYINSKAQPLQIEAGDGEIYFGTNFKNGEAVVSTINKKLYRIGKQGQIIEKVDLQKIFVDEKYCIMSSDDKSLPDFQKTAAEEQSTLNDGLMPYHEDNLYGYKNGNTIVLLPQFDKAFPFVNGTAKVVKQGKYGLLSIISNHSVTAKIKKSSLKVKKEVPEDIEYSVIFPAGTVFNSVELSAENLKKNQTEKCTLVSNTIENYAFKLTPQYNKGENRQEYQFQLKADDLILWKEKVEIELIAEYIPPPPPPPPQSPPPSFNISVAPKMIEADKNDEAWFSVNLENASNAPLEITVIITGEKLKDVSSTITIPANATKTLKTCFTQVIKKEERSVQVSTPKGNKIFSITLIPFY